MRILTMKFGGTSVGDATAIAQTVDIVRQAREAQAEQVVAVISAMRGVTNRLQEGLLCAAHDGCAFGEHADALRAQHAEAARALLGAECEPVIAAIGELIDAYLRFCEGVSLLGETTPRALDYTMGLGERMCARLVAAAVRKAGLPAEAVDATALIVTDDRHQDAAPLVVETAENVRRVLVPLLEAGVVPVVTGYIGATRDGVSTTLGRGGSDYSAALIGALLHSDEVWIWTDVDGVMSADPRIVPQARTIGTLTSREVNELAYFGARVLHPKTIRPVLEAGIPLRVKNTFNPSHPGTLIAPNGQASAGPIKAVTAIRAVSLITVEGMGMLGVPGIAARTFGAVARTGTSVLLISQASSEQSICFAVPSASAQRVVEAVEQEFALEIARRDIDRVWARDEVTIVTVVGSGMRELPGIAGRIFTATGEHGVNVIAIAQGSSECGVSLLVDAHDADEALRAIHPLTLQE